MQALRKYKWHILTGVAVFVLVFMHVFKLSEVPYGLNVDEASGAYDALNIARYGVDRYLKSYPAYFTNYGDGQNALYIYSTAVFIKLFGASKIVFRIAPAIAAVTAAFFGWKYMSSECRESRAKVIWLCLYAILPIFIMSQRFGLESHLLLPMSMVTLYFMTKAFDTGKWMFYLAAGISLGVTLYTYALTYIVLPVFLVLMLGYVLWLRRFEWKKVFVMMAVVAVLASPLIMVQLINLLDLPEMYIGPITLTKLLEYRVDEVAGTSMLQNLKSMFMNTLFYDDLTYNTSAKYGTFFYFSIPFILLGLIKCVYECARSLKDKRFSYAVPMTVWFGIEVGMGLFLSGHSVPNTTRMIGIFVPILYFLVKGLYAVRDFIRRDTAKWVFSAVMGICYLTTFLHFSVYYFTDYNEEAFPMKWLFYESYEEVGSFLEEHEDASWADRSVAYPWNYIYYVLEYEINPYDLNMPVNGFETFGKDYINEYPDETMLDVNYVVYRTDMGSREFLAQVGYEELLPGESFYFFVSPFDRFAEIPGEYAASHLDNKLAKDGQIFLSGWCADIANQSAFQTVKVIAGEAVYEAELSQRQDVASHLGYAAEGAYGFKVWLPIDTLETSDEITFIGVREDGTEESIISLEKK